MKEFALHILDIAENGIRAGATDLFISLELEEKSSVLRLEISDNGSGMDEATLKEVSSPFFTSREVRKVGLGIPLLRQHAEMTGGEVEIISAPGCGTRIIAWFDISHPDMQPAGDIEGCWHMVAAGNPKVNVTFRLQTALGNFTISSREILQELGEGAFSGSENRKLLLSLIRNNLEELEFNFKEIELTGLNS